jgi:hypothetical protein
VFDEMPAEDFRAVAEVARADLVAGPTGTFVEHLACTRRTGADFRISDEFLGCKLQLMADSSVSRPQSTQEQVYRFN